MLYPRNPNVNISSNVKWITWAWSKVQGQLVCWIRSNVTGKGRTNVMMTSQWHASQDVMQGM